MVVCTISEEEEGETILAFKFTCHPENQRNSERVDRGFHFRKVCLCFGFQEKSSKKHENIVSSLDYDLF